MGGYVTGVTKRDIITEGNVKQRGFDTVYKSEEDRQTARIISTLIMVTSAAYVFFFFIGRYYDDGKLSVATLAGIVTQVVPFVLLRRGHLRASSFILLFSVLGTLTVLATVGQGIHDAAIIAFPVTYFIARLTMNRTYFRICVGLTLVVIGWLVFGENLGWFISQPFEPPSWVSFLVTAVILFGTAYAVDVVTMSMQKNLERTKYEIKQRERVEEALRESQKRLEDIIFSLSDWVWEVDGDGIYTYSSSRGIDILGRSPDEIIGKTPFDFMTPDESKRVYPIYCDIVEKKEPIKDLENWNIDRNGNIICLLTNGVPILDNEGNIRGYRGVDKDITERKHAEAIRAKIEAQYTQIQKASSLARMAEAIAHNFNNMLAIIIGNLELAVDTRSKGKDSEEYIAEAVSAARRAAEISGQMLVFLGQTAGTRGLVNMCEICRGYVTVLRAAIPPNISLETNLPSPGPELFADASQIRQIITNLVCNAWESMGDGIGTIRLTIKTATPSNLDGTYRFPVDWQPRGNAYVCLEVADAGCGIPAVDVDNIFDPFFTKKFTGRGLGLPVVLGIVRAYDGVVTLESEPGRGSVFRVFLPKYGA